MRQLQIEVLTANTSFVKTAKGGYNVLELAYKADGKVTGKKVLDFATPDTYKVLAAAKAGEVFDITAEKNDKGYLDWVSAVPGVALPVVPDAEAPITGASAVGRGGSSGYGQRPGRVIGNTYETPEERLVKQAAIIRQATINMAVAYLSQAAGVPSNWNMQHVLQSAREFEDHVYTDLQARAESLRAVVDGLKG